MAQGTRIVIVDGKSQQFPADATDAEISAALNAIPAANAPHAPKARTWSESGDSGGVGLALAGNAVPGAAQLASSLATSRTLPATAAKVGRVIGGVAPIVAGAKTGGPVGAVAGIAASARGAWAGGKTGWFTGKMVQGMAAPVAKVLQDVAPYAQALSTLGGVQGGLDLAQMAEPNRKDIGFLGIGLGDPQTPEEAKAHPPLLNLAYAKVAEAVKYLMDQGMKQSEAVRAVMNAKAKGSK